MQIKKVKKEVKAVEKREEIKKKYFVPSLGTTIEK